MPTCSPTTKTAALALAALLTFSTFAGSVPGAVPSSTGLNPKATCQDVDEQYTFTATGVPDETVAGSSVEAQSVTSEIGSEACRIVTLEATLSSSGAAVGGNETSDTELVVSFEGISVKDSRNPGSNESVTLDGAPWGTYEFTVEPWNAVEAPVTLNVSADLEPDPAASGDNADDEAVVVAFVDTGINPYHDEFAAETYPGSLDLSEHPGKYIEEYPDAAPSLDLTLDASYEDAREADDWANVSQGKLYWIPGTKIVGAYDGGGDIESGDNVIDENGHGTASVSVAAGNTLGTCERCLVVSVEGEQGLDWALAQPWIDLVSNSWGTIGNAGVPTAGNNDVDPLGAGGDTPSDTRSAVTRGQTVFAAAGNGMANAFLTPQTTYTSPLAGPDWTVTVGAVQSFDDCDCSQDEGIVATSGKPVDVSSYAAGDIPAASHNSTSEQTQHSGTSSATPIAAGVAGEVLLEAREAVGDTVGGTRDAAIAEGDAVGGLLADGELTRAELEEAVKLTAEHTNSTWLSVYPPGGPTFFLPEDKLWTQWAAEGWGTVGERTGANATALVLGEEPVPERPFDQQQADIDERNREALWGPAVAP